MCDCQCYFSGGTSITIIGLGTWLIAPFKTDIHTISLILGISILATITFAGINTMIVMINQNKASSSIICLVVSLLMFGISFYVLSVCFLLIWLIQIAL